MAHARHEKARTRFRGWLRVVAPIAALVAGASGVAAQAGPDVRSETHSSAAAADAFDDRVTRASREQAAAREPLRYSRPETKARRVVRTEPTAVDRKYLSTALHVRTGPGQRFRLLDVLPKRAKVAVTGNRIGPWAEVVRSDKSRWVRAEHVVNKRPPRAEPTTGISGTPCVSGSSVESGLTSNAVAVHRAVCAQFPQVTSYGGLRSDGYHSQGRALDIMITGSTGDAIAEWVRANSGALGASEVLWSQRIWTVQRSSEGWRYFEDRGSTTANHYDHVHVTVY